MTNASPSKSPLNTFFEKPLWQAIVLAIVAIVFYGNTFNHDYALDDGLVIKENPYTKQGFAGISDIFTKDAYSWYYEQAGAESKLTGGRYRPLSIVTHAIEYEIFGPNPTVSHIVNVLLYALCGIVLLYLLHKFWLRKQPRLAFLTALLFLLLPIHSEAVANIKGRDELLSFLLLFLSLYLLFRNLKQVWAAAGVFFLALLTKENGITFLAVIPVSLMLFRKETLKSAIQLTFPFLIAAVAYLAIRYMVVGFGSGSMNDIMNDPFLYATPMQAFATKMVVLFKYLQLQVWPMPLSYDYGYATFAYPTLSDPRAWLGILLHVGILAVGLWAWKRNPILSFACLFYLLTLSIISNLVINIGATMGERLIFLSSFGFVLGIAWLVMQIYKALPKPTQMAWYLGFAVVALVAAGFRTIDRNKDWKSNRTLFTHDVQSVPNSIKANTAAGGEYVFSFLDNSDTTQLYKALDYYQKAETLYPVRQDSFERKLFLYDNWCNQGWIYYNLGDIEQAEVPWAKAFDIKPFHPKILEYHKLLVNHYLRKASEIAQSDLEASLPYYEKAAAYGPKSVDAWYNLGGANYTAGHYVRAKQAFEHVLKINPNHTPSQQGLQAVNQILGGQ